MSGVLLGFSVIGFVVAVGWLLGRTGVVDQQSRLVLNQVSFYAAGPALLFTVLAAADVTVLFSGVLAVQALSLGLASGIYALLARLLLTRDPGRLVMVSGAAGYANANNIGLPIAVYVIGDAQFVGPLLMLQLLVVSPLLLAALDAVANPPADARPAVAGTHAERAMVRAARRRRVRHVLSQPLRTPLVLGSAAGALVSALGVEVPLPVLAPLELLGGAAVPLMLLAFGVSLGGQRPLQPRSGRREVVLAVAVKVALMPLLAFVLGRFVLGLSDDLVYACTVLAALPSAQNMYQFALRYRTAEIVTRDVVLLSTLLAVPAMLVVAALLR